MKLRTLLLLGSLLGFSPSGAQARTLIELPVFPAAIGSTVAMGVLFGSKFLVGPSAYYALAVPSRFAFGVKTRYFLNGKPFSTSFVVGPEAHYTSVSATLGTGVNASIAFGSHLQIAKSFALIALIRTGTGIRLTGSGINLDIFTPMTLNSFFFNAELSLAFTFGK